MTPAEHAQQKAWVIASEMLQASRSQRHGVYVRRTRPLPPAVPAPVERAMHVFVLPVVTERLL